MKLNDGSSLLSTDLIVAYVEYNLDFYDSLKQGTVSNADSTIYSKYSEKPAEGYPARNINFFSSGNQGDYDKQYIPPRILSDGT